MTVVTATEMARNFRAWLDRVEFRGEEIVLVRNNHRVARIVPGAVPMTALEAMGDLHGILSDEVGSGWEKDARKRSKRAMSDEVRDPWGS